MLEISLFDIFGRAVYAGFTIYMMMILLRWLGPYVHFDMENVRVRWIWRLTDPLIAKMRVIALEHLKLPRIGSIDYGPALALFAVWIVRAIVLAVLMRGAMIV